MKQTLTWIDHNIVIAPRYFNEPEVNRVLCRLTNLVLVNLMANKQNDFVLLVYLDFVQADIYAARTSV